MGLLSFTWCYNAKYHNPFGGTSFVPSADALLFYVLVNLAFCWKLTFKHRILYKKYGRLSEKNHYHILSLDSKIVEMFIETLFRFIYV